MKLMKIVLMLFFFSIGGVLAQDEYPAFYRTDYDGLGVPSGLVQSNVVSSQELGTKLYVGDRVYESSRPVEVPSASQTGIGQNQLVLAGYTAAQTAGYQAKVVAVQQMTAAMPVSAPLYGGLPTFVAGTEIDSADRFAKLKIVSPEFDPSYFPGEPIFVSWEGSRMLDLGISRYMSMAGITYSGQIADLPKTYIDAEKGLLAKIASLQGGIDPNWPVVQIPGTPLRAALTLGPLVQINEYQFVSGYADLQFKGSSGVLITYIVTIISPQDRELAKYVITWAGDRPMLLIIPPNTPLI